MGWGVARERKEPEKTWDLNHRDQAKFPGEGGEFILGCADITLMLNYLAKYGCVGWRKFGATDVETPREHLKSGWVIPSRKHGL